MAAVDLLFEGLPYGPGEIPLIFGGSGGAPRPSVAVTHAVTLPAPAFSMTVAYDNRVTRWRDQRVTMLHQVAQPVVKSAEPDWGSSKSERGGTSVNWKKGVKKQVQIDSVFGRSAKRRSVAAVAWQTGDPVLRDTSATWQVPLHRQSTKTALWQKGAAVNRDTSLSTETGARRRAIVLGLWQVGQREQRETTSVMGASARHRGAGRLVVWEQARLPPQGRSVRPPVPPNPDVWTPDLDLLFQCRPASAPWTLLFSRYPCGYIPAHNIVLVRRTYMIFNSATLRRVEGNLALPVDSMSLSLDADSWTWGFSAGLPGSTLSNIEPSSYGVPVEVEATVNGLPFRLLLGDVTRDREFGRSSISVPGRGKSSLLDSPTARVMNFGNTAIRTAQQLMADVLTDNGSPLGWSVNWGIDDWTVPANVFSHQGTYISALNAIAGAAGAYLQSHATDQEFNVLARYPVPPWEWEGLTPDYELPSAVVRQEGIQWTQKPDYNRVFVQGQQSGILGNVLRAGTAGDVLAPLVVDQLITEAVAARQRGTRILSDTGRQAMVTLRLPVLPETGIIVPGKSVRYVDGGETRFGFVRSVRVAVGMPEIWQSIGVETHVN